MLEMRMGQDVFITRHLDYTGSYPNGTNIFPTRPFACDEAASSVELPYLAILETVWLSEANDTQTELLKSLRHKSYIKTMKDQDAFSELAKGTAVFSDEENNVFPVSKMVDGRRYSFHVNIFMQPLPFNYRVIKHKVACKDTSSYRYELVDEEFHMSTAFGRFSSSPYTRTSSITGRKLASFSPYVSRTNDTRVMPHKVSGSISRHSLALPLEIVHLRDVNYASNREELCKCTFVTTCDSTYGESQLDVMSHHRIPVMQMATTTSLETSSNMWLLISILLTSFLAIGFFAHFAIQRLMKTKIAYAVRRKVSYVTATTVSIGKGVVRQTEISHPT